MTRSVSISCFAALGILAASADDWRDRMWERPMRLRDGVSARAYALEAPRKMKAYVVRIDLTTPGIGFTATERAADWGSRIAEVTNGVLCTETKLEATTDFMARRRREGLNVEVAVNATPWKPFPAPEGCKVCDPLGWCVEDGEEVSCPKSHEALFVVRKDGSCEITGESCRPSDAAVAVSGFDLILTNGVDAAEVNRLERKHLHPRMALGLTPDRKTLVLLAVDGRQPGYSDGADIDDLRAILRREGVSDAVNMDGGGSTSLVVWDCKGSRPLMLNRHKGGAVRKTAMNLGISFGDVPSGLPEGRALSQTNAHGSSYRFEPIADTPPPEGYKPFYISHYGRHGSRRVVGPCVADTDRVLADADAAGALTDEGRRLRATVRRFAEEHDGMDGELTERGAQEQRRLARRMAARFPDVFRDRRRVRCRASTVPRVLMSMQNFTLSLKESVPGLDFDFTTGERHKQLLVQPWYAKNREGIGKRIKEIVEADMMKTLDADAVVRRFFTDAGIVKSPSGFVQDLFVCASHCQCLSVELDGIDMWGFFSPEEAAALSRCSEAEAYGGMANSVEFGDVFLRASAPLALDIVKRAEKAIADDRVAADLRFGHDQGVWPLAGLIGIEGPGDRVSIKEAWAKCPAWKWSPMAANLQIALYAREGRACRDRRDVLVKVLYNEREMSVRGMPPVCGVYYRWTDFADMVASRVTCDCVISDEHKEECNEIR